MLFLLVMSLPPALWRQEWHKSILAELYKLEAQTVSLTCTGKAIHQFLSLLGSLEWLMILSNIASWKEKNQSYSLCEHKVSYHDGPHSKDAATLPLKSFVNRGSFWLKCRAAAELCSSTFGGPKLAVWQPLSARGLPSGSGAI